jgi:hypothetical protein
MVIEMLLNDDIQFIFYSNDFKLSTWNKFNYVRYWNFKINKFESFHLNKILVRYEFSNLMFL